MQSLVLIGEIDGGNATIFTSRTPPTAHFLFNRLNLMQGDPAGNTLLSGIFTLATPPAIRDTLEIF